MTQADSGPAPTELTVQGTGETPHQTGTARSDQSWDGDAQPRIVRAELEEQRPERSGVGYMKRRGCGTLEETLDQVREGFVQEATAKLDLEG